VSSFILSYIIHRKVRDFHLEYLYFLLFSFTLFLFFEPVTFKNKYKTDLSLRLFFFFISDPFQGQYLILSVLGKNLLYTFFMHLVTTQFYKQQYSDSEKKVKQL